MNWIIIVIIVIVVNVLLILYFKKNRKDEKSMRDTIEHDYPGSTEKGHDIEIEDKMK